MITAVENGESVTIYRRGVPVVDIVRTAKADPGKPKFGTLTGKVTALDPDWWKPSLRTLDDETADALSASVAAQGKSRRGRLDELRNPWPG